MSVAAEAQSKNEPKSDAEVVEAFVAAWSAMPVAEGQNLATILETATVLPFERGDKRAG